MVGTYEGSASFEQWQKLRDSNVWKGSAGSHTTAERYLRQQDPSDGVGDGSVSTHHVELHSLLVELDHVHPKQLPTRRRVCISYKHHNSNLALNPDLPHIFGN